nr:reverse transcriptase domain-containing protein [Tanacetum cinerariifolium]
MDRNPPGIGQKEEGNEESSMEGGNWKSRLKKTKSSIEEDELSQPWVCEETNPFTPYAKVECWALPTWCNMFNSTLTRSTRKEGESIEDFVQRFKAESMHVKGDPECMRNTGFMHEITKLELIKHLHDNIPKSVDEMMWVTATFLGGEVAAFNQARKKTLPAWKPREMHALISIMSYFPMEYTELVVVSFFYRSYHWGWESFHLYTDEFFGSKITIFIQWDHRKAKSEEDSSSPINSSRNAKILSPERDTHSLEQQDNTTRIHDGLWTRSITFRYHLGSGRKNQSDHYSKISRTNNCNRLYYNRGRTEAEHKLSVREGCSPVRQKKRSQAPERNKVIQKEVEKLVDNGIMKEVHYHSWLSNPVMVKKHDDSYRMCVDFKELNKACPKDGYSLPEID